MALQFANASGSVFYPNISFAWLDILVSAVVVLVLIVADGRQQRMKHLWAPFLPSFTMGVSLSLPLFLSLRELHISSNISNIF